MSGRASFLGIFSTGCVSHPRLVNTAIAVAHDPNRMAVAFKDAVNAGRTAFEVGLGSPQWTASATSPLTGFLDAAK